MTPKTQKSIRTALIYTGLGFVTLIAVFPIFWLITSSIRPYLELMTFPPKFIPSKFDLKFYRDVLTNTSFAIYIVNSLRVGLLSTAISVTAATLSGYSVARTRFRFKNLIGRGILIAYMFPQIVLAVPLFVGLVRLRMTNTHFGLILTHVTFSFPFSMWLLVAYFRTISVDMEAAAKIDGATNIQAFTHITLPLAVPGIATAAIFSFNLSWREFLYALLLINKDKLKTVTVGLYTFIGGEYMRWGELLAASTMVGIPTVIIFLLLQRYIVGGLTGGALKG